MTLPYPDPPQLCLHPHPRPLQGHLWPLQTQSQSKQRAGGGGWGLQDLLEQAAAVQAIRYGGRGQPVCPLVLTFTPTSRQQSDLADLALRPPRAPLLWTCSHHLRLVAGPGPHILNLQAPLGLQGKLFSPDP